MPEERLNPTTHLPMSPVADVFGGEKQTPHSVFQKSRTESAGAVANHRPNDLAHACPTCERNGQAGVRLWTKPDAGYYCLNGHRWKDFDELMSLDPTKMAFKGTPARQDGFVKMTIEMPGSVGEALTKKFGDRLGATLSAVMEVISSGKFVMMGENDVTRITQHIGEEVKSSAFIVGKIVDLKTTVNEQKETIERLENKIATLRGRPSTKSDTEFTVDLGEELAAKVAELAKSRDLTVDEVISATMQQYLVDNNWG